MNDRRRAAAAAAAIAVVAAITACAPSPDAVTVDDFTGTWVAEGIDATVTLDDDWSMTIRGEDTDVLVPSVDSIDTVWTPDVRVNSQGSYAMWAYEDEPRKQSYGGQIYFIGTKDDPRISMGSYSPPYDVIEFVPAD
jgi:hypothetical protein